MSNVVTDHQGVNRFWRFWEATATGTKIVVTKLTTGTTVANQAPGLAQGVAVGTGTLARRFRCVITDYALNINQAPGAATASATISTATSHNVVAKISATGVAGASTIAATGLYNVCLPCAADEGIELVVGGTLNAGGTVTLTIAGYYAPCGTDDSANSAGPGLADKYTGVP